MAGPSSAAGTSFTAGAIKTLTGHLEGTAGLAGLLLGHVALSQQFAHGLRYRWGGPQTILWQKGAPGNCAS